jgi:hypothetical protein
MDAARQKEIARLREAVEQAKSLYDSAKREVERANELHSDLEATNPDGHRACALRAQNEAMVNYMNALVAFNQYVLSSKPPIV